MLERLKTKIKRWLYRGNAVICSLCGSSLSGFRAAGIDDPRFDASDVIGMGLRQADECPVCWGRDRTRAMQFYLERRVLSAGFPVCVLHMAPEFALGRWLQGQSLVTYTAADIDPARYRSLGQVEAADVAALKFEDGQFQIVICSHVLEHIPDDRVAMSEIARVMATGGVALLQVPYADDGRETDEDPTILDANERIARFGQDDHVRLYALNDYVSRLEGAGLRVSLIDLYSEDASAAAALHLNPDEKLIVATKQ